MITLAIAMRCTLRTEGLAALLATEANFRVIGRACGARETVCLVQGPRPPVSVVDLFLSDAEGMDGPDVAGRCRSPVVALSPEAGEPPGRRAARCGNVPEYASSADRSVVARTVSGHRAKVKLKLRAPWHAGLVRYAYRTA